jgi:hypothetical protein
MEKIMKDSNVGIKRHSLWTRCGIRASKPDL